MNDTNKYFVIYKVTNKLNSRFYIGMHATNNLNDGYLGSGKRIKAEVKKYGKENFVKEILFFCKDRKDLILTEKEIVNEELRSNPLCLNLKDGGEGGFANEEHRINSIAALVASNYSSKRNRITTAKKIAEVKALKKESGLYSEEQLDQMKNGSRAGLSKAVIAAKSPEAKAKRNISVKNAFKEIGHSQGEKNSNFGKCWVTDGEKAIPIKKELLSEYLIKGYSKGRKIKQEMV